MFNVIKRLAVSRKIALVAATFALPVVVLLALVVFNIEEFIDFGRKELVGDRYQRPLEAVLARVLEHDALVGQCSAGACEGLDVSRQRVDAAFETLAVVDREIGRELDFTPEGLGSRGRQDFTVAKVRGEWAAVAISKTKDADIDAKYAKIIADVRGMIGHMGDTSNLILDPDLDSYYLMDATLVALPQSQDRIAEVTRFGRELLVKGNPSISDRTKMAVFAALMTESDIARVKASVGTAVKEDAHFYGVSPTLQAKLPPAVAAYENDANAFVAMTKQIADGTATFDAGAYAAAGAKARARSFEIWDVAVDELDVLLRARVASYESRLFVSIASAVFAIFVASGLAWVLSRSITQPLVSLASTLSPGSTLLSECVNRIARVSGGAQASMEAQVVCEELEAHAADMLTTVAQLDAVVNGGIPRALQATTRRLRADSGPDLKAAA